MHRMAETRCPCQCRPFAAIYSLLLFARGVKDIKSSSNLFSISVAVGIQALHTLCLHKCRSVDLSTASLVGVAWRVEAEVHEISHGRVNCM